jgi:hypothetical protein
MPVEQAGLRVKYLPSHLRRLFILVKENFYAALADLVLTIHFALVAFNIAGFVVIWIGYFRGWSFVRYFGFRAAHLLVMGLIAFQTLAGLTCPLTTWENALRVQAGEAMRYEESCLEHWLGRILFYDVSDWVFTVSYVGFFAFVVLTFWKVPPRWPKQFWRRPSA